MQPPDFQCFISSDIHHIFAKQHKKIKYEENKFHDKSLYYENRANYA